MRGVRGECFQEMHQHLERDIQVLGGGVFGRVVAEAVAAADEDVMMSVQN